MALKQFAGRAITKNGKARSGISVTVKDQATQATSTIYSESDGSVAQANPITTGTDGGFAFYAIDGRYTVEDDLGFQLADVSLRSRINRLVYVKKADDLPSKANDTTLENDSTLAFEVGAYEKWFFYMLLHPSSNSSGDIKWAFTIPAAATFSNKLTQLFNFAPNRLGLWSTALDTTDAYTGGNLSPTNNIFRTHGYIETAANGGTIQFQYAQNTSFATPTYIAEDSYLIARRIG